MKAYVAVGVEDRQIYCVDVIEHAGHLWLVPEWLTAATAAILPALQSQQVVAPALTA